MLDVKKKIFSLLIFHACLCGVIWRGIYKLIMGMLYLFEFGNSIIIIIIIIIIRIDVAHVFFLLIVIMNILFGDRIYTYDLIVEHS